MATPINQSNIDARNAAQRQMTTGQKAWNTIDQGFRVVGGVGQGTIKAAAAPLIAGEEIVAGWKRDLLGIREKTSDFDYDAYTKRIGQLRSAGIPVTAGELSSAWKSGRLTQEQYRNTINEWQTAGGTPTEVAARESTKAVENRPITAAVGRANAGIEKWTNSWVSAPQSGAAEFVAKAADALGEAIPVTLVAAATGGGSPSSILAGTTLSHAVGSANAFSTEMLEGSGDLGRASISAATEWGAEALGGKLFNSAADKIANPVASWAVNAVGEGAEEVISGGAQALLTGEEYTPQMAAEEFALGLTVGAVLDGAMRAVNAVSSQSATAPSNPGTLSTSTVEHRSGVTNTNNVVKISPPTSSIPNIQADVTDSSLTPSTRSDPNRSTTIPDAPINTTNSLSTELGTRSLNDRSITSMSSGTWVGDFAPGGQNAGTNLVEGNVAIKSEAAPDSAPVPEPIPFPDPNPDGTPDAPTPSEPGKVIPLFPAPGETPYLVPVEPAETPPSEPEVQPSTEPDTNPDSEPKVIPFPVEPAVVPEVLPETEPEPDTSPEETPNTNPPPDQPDADPTTPDSPDPNQSPEPDSAPSPDVPPVQPDTQPDATPSTQPETNPVPDLQPSAEPNSEPIRSPDTQPTTEPYITPAIQPTPAPVTAPQTVPNSQPQSEPGIAPSPSPQTSPTPDNFPQSQPATAPQTESLVQPSSQPSSQPEARTQQQTEAEITAQQIWAPVQAMEQQAKQESQVGRYRKRRDELPAYTFDTVRGAGSRGQIFETSGYGQTFGGLSSY